MHLLFGAKPEREWASGDPHHITLVFIGRDVDRTASTAAFKACFGGRICRLTVKAAHSAGQQSADRQSSLPARGRPARCLRHVGREKDMLAAKELRAIAAKRSQR